MVHIYNSTTQEAEAEELPPSSRLAGYILKPCPPQKETKSENEK